MRGQRWHDYSGKGNHGTIYGASWTSKGRLGPALSFDGVDDYVKVPDSASLDSIDKDKTYTFEAWVNSKGINTESAAIFAKAGDGGCSDRNGMSHKGTTLAFGYYDGAAWHGVSGIMSQNEWHHVVGVNNAGNLYLYIDGVSQTGTGVPYVACPDSLLLGYTDYGSNAHYGGLIDEVRIYNRALPADEIKALYELGAEVRE